MSYSFFKKKKRAINSGISVGKGISTANTGVNPDNLSPEAWASHTIGIALSPLMFVVPNTFLEKIAQNKKQLLELSAPAGFIWGGYMGSLTSNTLTLTDLPAYFDSAIGIATGTFIMMSASLLLPILRKKNLCRK